MTDTLVLLAEVVLFMFLSGLILAMAAAFVAVSYVVYDFVKIKWRKKK